MRIPLQKLVKQIIMFCIFSNKITAEIYFRRQYRKVSQRGVASRLGKIAHGFDNRLREGGSSFRGQILEFGFLLKRAKNLGVPFDHALHWACAMYTMVVHKMNSCYLETSVSPRKNEVVLADTMLQAAVKERRSVRKWTGKPVNCDMILAIIELAKWAPSSCNRQPTLIKILETEEDRQFIQEYFPKEFWHKAPVQLLICAEVGAYRSGDDWFPYFDTGAFIQNLLLLIHGAGLGACWLGFKGWTCQGRRKMSEEQYNKFYEYFSFEKGVVPVSMVVAGYPEVIPGKPCRNTLQSILLEGKQNA